MLFKLPNLNSNLALTLGYLNPPWNNSALDIRIPEILACGIWNRGKFCLWSPEYWALESAKQLKESGIPLTIAIRNPSSTNKESWIHGMEFRIQDCLEFRYIEWRIVVDLFLNKKFKDFSRTFKDTFPIFQGLHSVQKRALSLCLFWFFNRMSNFIPKVFLHLLVSL